MKKSLMLIFLGLILLSCRNNATEVVSSYVSSSSQYSSENSVSDKQIISLPSDWYYQIVAGHSFGDKRIYPDLELQLPRNVDFPTDPSGKVVEHPDVYKKDPISFSFIIQGAGLMDPAYPEAMTDPKCDRKQYPYEVVYSKTVGNSVLKKIKSTCSTTISFYLYDGEKILYELSPASRLTDKQLKMTEAVINTVKVVQ